MGNPRRKLSREFKLKVVKQVVEHGRSVAGVAKGLGVNPNVLTRWKSELQSDGSMAFPGNGNQTST